MTPRSIAIAAVCLCAQTTMPGVSGGVTAGTPEKNAHLVCYVGGTMRPAVEALAKAYQAQTGARIDIDYSSSGEAIIKAKLTGRGDLIVVHDPYAGQIMKEKLGARCRPVAVLTGVIAVPKGNPKKIAGLADLAKPGMRVILSDSVYSTLGHVMRVIARRSTVGDKLMANVLTFTKASAEAANAVALGTGDAAIVWDAVAKLRSDKLDIVPIEQRYQPVEGVDAITTATFGRVGMSRTEVTVVRLARSKQPESADRLAEFMASEPAQAIWAQQGFAPVSDSTCACVDLNAPRQ